MESIIHADIFFFITSIFVIVLTILMCIIGSYLVKAMRNFSRISDTLKDAVDDADDELRELVLDVRESALFRFVFGRRSSRRGKKDMHATKT